MRQQGGRLNVAIGDIMRGELSTLRLSQSDLAARAGMHRNTVSNLLNGKRQISVADLDKWCDALDLDLVTVLVRARERVETLRAKGEAAAEEAVSQDANTGPNADGQAR